MSGELELQLGAAIKSCGYGSRPSPGRRRRGGGNRVASSRAICEHAAMKTNAKKIAAVPSAVAARVDAIDWTATEGELDAQGCAVLKSLLTADECRVLAAFYPDDSHFRSRIVMGRHGFGRGEYNYF